MSRLLKENERNAEETGVVADTATLKLDRGRLTLAERVGALPAELWLTGLVIASFAARLAAAWKHTAPRLFPDEYIYAQLANSVAHGRLTIRGQSAHFPALLEPLLAAPFWLSGNVEVSYRLTQAMHALIASMVAIPVCLLARRLALPAWQSLLCAACAVLLPGLVFASYVSADAVGLTFAVAATYTGVRAVESPTRGTQLAFLGLAGLATFARIQYVILFVAFLVGALLMSGGRPLRAVSRYRLAVAAVCGPALAVVVLGPGRALGYYQNVVDLHSSWGVGRWAASDAMLIVYSCGYVLVPAAVVGLVLAIARPQSPAERALGAFAAPFIVLLLAEASVYAANGSARFQERYLMALQPLVPILFCLCLRRQLGRASRLAATGFSVGFLILAARVPLSGYTVYLGSQDSPFLQALVQLQQLTSTGTGSLVVALSVVGLSIPALLPLARWRYGVAIALATAATTLFVISVGATVTDVQAAQSTSQLMPRDVRWVDHSGLRNVSVLVTASSFRPSVSAHLFWNRSLTHVLQMTRGQDLVDAFSYDRVRVLRDGTLLAGGRFVTGPLLVEEYADTVTVGNAMLVRLDNGASLWQPTGPAQLVTLTYGRYLDGWLSARRATITVWPHRNATRRGALCLDFSLPGSFQRDIRLQGPSFSKSVVVDSHGESVAVPVVAAEKPWVLRILAPVPLSDAGRLVAAQLKRPRFVEVPPGSSQALSTACR